MCLLISNTLIVLQTNQQQQQQKKTKRRRKATVHREMPSILFNENMSAVSLIYFIIAIIATLKNLYFSIKTSYPDGLRIFVFHL